LKQISIYFKIQQLMGFGLLCTTLLAWTALALAQNAQVFRHRLRNFGAGTFLDA